MPVARGSGTMGKAIVVGAGLAGLTAAWRLRQAGFSVTVFERAPRAGGRIHSVRLGDCVVDTGATVFLPAYRETLALIDELGLAGELQNVCGQVVIPRDDRLHVIDIDVPLRALFTYVIGWRSKFALLRLLVKYLSIRSRLNFTSLGAASGKDTETLERYCQRVFPAEVYTYLLNPAIKFLYIHNGASGSLIELLWWLRASGAGKPRSLRRGSGSLIDALAARLDVQTGTEVTQVAVDEDRVSIAARHADGELRRHRADVCVVALPGTDAAAVCRGVLSPAQRQFLAGRRYDCSIVVSFCIGSRPTPDALMFLIPDETDAELATVIYGHNIGAGRAANGQGVINAYFMGVWSERHWSLSDEAVMQAARVQIKNLVSEVDSALAWHVQRWTHTAAIVEPGDCEKIQALEAERDPVSPIQIIGDFVAQASMNVAVAGANRAAQRLIEWRALR